MIAHMVLWLGLAFVTALFAGVTAKLPVPSAPLGADLPDGADSPLAPAATIQDRGRVDRPKLPQEIVDALAAVKLGSRAMPANGYDRTPPIGADQVSREHPWIRALHARPPYEIL